MPLRTIAAQWARIGSLGFGGPPAHIAMARKLVVEQRGWIGAEEFEDGVAAANLMPGPASTQLLIYCAWRAAGPLGAVVGGACFILPGLVVILVLAAVFLAASPPEWVSGAAAGAGAAVPAVAVAAAVGLVPASWKRAGKARAARARWLAYLVAGGVVGAVGGQFLVLVLAACGLIELAIRTGRPGRAAAAGAPAADPPAPDPPAPDPPAPDPPAPDPPGLDPPAPDPPGLDPPGLDPPGLDPPAGRRAGGLLPLALAVPAAGGLLALAWVAFKVGALSYGGGFVIVPLMQHDAVTTYHWMTGQQFLSAVALGQVTPGPVVQTVAVVGYAAGGLPGGLLASLVAFAPSFAFVMAGAPRFGRLRRSARVQAFLTGAGPAAIGAIAGSTIPLGLELAHLWQAGVLVLAAAWLLLLRKNVVVAVAGGAALGIIAALAGLPVG